MSRLQELSESFKLQYEKFVNACDAKEQEGAWDLAGSGQMEGYYFNDIMSAIVLLISADGNISREEADYINDIFGFRYSPEDLKEIVRTSGEDMRQMLETEVPAGYRKMKSIDAELAEHYKYILLLVCDILAESDGQVRAAELGEIEKLRQSLAD